MTPTNCTCHPGHVCTSTASCKTARELHFGAPSAAQETQQATPEPDANARRRKACLNYAAKHPVVLEIMADCAHGIDAENSAFFGPVEWESDPWLELARQLKAEADAERAKDPEIWPTLSFGDTRPAATPEPVNRCAQCQKPYRQGVTCDGCPKCAPGVRVTEAEFQQPLATPEPVGEARGTWRVNGRMLYSDDFSHDAALTLTGDFESDEQRGQFAANVCAALNATRPAAAPADRPMFIGACITEGRLHATVMRRESNDQIKVLATAEMDAASLHGHDHIAEMRAAAPAVQWFTVAEHGMPDVGEEVIGGLWFTDPWLKPEIATSFLWGRCRVVTDAHRDFKDGKRWQTFGPSHNQITHWARFNRPALAAAQAKGGE